MLRLTTEGLNCTSSAQHLEYFTDGVVGNLRQLQKDGRDATGAEQRRINEEFPKLQKQLQQAKDDELGVAARNSDEKFRTWVYMLPHIIEAFLLTVVACLCCTHIHVNKLLICHFCCFKNDNCI